MSSSPSVSADNARAQLVELLESPTDGRYAVAGSDIRAGTLLHMALPYVSVMSPYADRTRCRCCFARLCPLDGDAADGAEEGADGAAPPTPTCCETCKVTQYCSDECRAIFHTNYHHCSPTEDATNATLNSSASFVFGEDCTAKCILNLKTVRERIEKICSPSDWEILSLLVGVFRKVEMEARRDRALRGEGAEQGGVRGNGPQQQQQAAAWLTESFTPKETIGVPSVDDDGSGCGPSQADLDALMADDDDGDDDGNSLAIDFDSFAAIASQPAGGANAGFDGDAPPAEALRVIAKQKALVKAEVADPVYCKAMGAAATAGCGSAGDGDAASAAEAALDALVSTRLRDALSAVTTYSHAALLLGGTATDAGADDGQRLDIGGTSGVSSRKPSCAGFACSSSPSALLREAITPRWSDVALLVSNYSVMPARRHDLYARIHGWYDKLRKLALQAVVVGHPSRSNGGNGSSGSKGRLGSTTHPYFLPEVSERILSSVACAIACNSFGLYARDEDVILGTAVVPFSSYFNHSCNPNIARVMVGPEARFYALRDIPKGEWLCISYVDSALPRGVRREDLLASYRFFCRCGRCEGREGEGYHRCGVCNVPKNYLRPLIEEGPNGEERDQRYQCIYCHTVQSIAPPTA